MVGLPRSGSTLWLHIFEQSPQLCTIGEMHFLTPWRKDFRNSLSNKVVGDLSSPEQVDQLIELVFTGDWHNEMGEADSPALRTIIRERLLNSDRSLGSFFKTFVEEISMFKGYDRCCVKFPVFVNHLPELLEWYPECRIVHITRDPRAMVVSRTHYPGHTRFSEWRHLRYVVRQMMTCFVVMQYLWTSKLHTEYKGLSNYRLFRYEDLLMNPERTVRQLCDFSGIRFVPEMLHPREGQVSSITRRKHKNFDKEGAVRWKKVISPIKERIITMLTSQSMKRFEYDPERHRIFLTKGMT
ncbi:hypothetical protein ES705_25921 [subsurface metagenome]